MVAALFCPCYHSIFDEVGKHSVHRAGKCQGPVAADMVPIAPFLRDENNPATFPVRWYGPFPRRMAFRVGASCCLASFSELLKTVAGMPSSPWEVFLFMVPIRGAHSHHRFATG